MNGFRNRGGGQTLYGAEKEQETEDASQEAHGGAGKNRPFAADDGRADPAGEGSRKDGGHEGETEQDAKEEYSLSKKLFHVGIVSFI